MAGMAIVTIGSSFTRRGRAVKISVTYEDTGPESCKAAFAELDARLQEAIQAHATPVVRQSYRKKKAPKKSPRPRRIT
jgi:hypothetical protein